MLSMILRSSTSSLNSPGCSGSALLSSLVAKSMRPVGTQSRFTTPLGSLLFLPLARLVINASGFSIARSLTSNQEGISQVYHRLQPLFSVRFSQRIHDIVRLSCEKCGRSGRLPDLREEIAQCSRHGQTHDACMVRYVDLIPKAD